MPPSLKFMKARLSALACAATLVCIAFATRVTAAPPNVIVFLADDAGWGDYSHNGNTNIRTPNIDSIATGGAKFDRFYVCAVCAPTRAEFLTGRYHPRGGVRGVSTGQERLNLDERTVADAFKAAGYATGAFGKWHNGSQWPYHPQARGFDEYYGHTSGHWGEYFDPPLEHNGRMVREKGYIVDLCTDKALDFINRNKEKPFFCYVPFTTPHSPWAVPDSFWQRFRTKPIGLRATDPAQENEEHTRCALAMVEQQDWNVGRILRRLDELKLTENTIVLYFSDNGPNSARWTGGMKGRKGSVDEGGVRSPLILRWPAKVKPGTMVREITGAIDLLPTLTSLAGVPRVGDKPLDGRDLSPLLFGQKVTWPERNLFNVQNNNLSVRSQQYRLDPQGALFDMVADPGQTKNVAAEKADVAARLTQAANDWRASIPGAAKAPAPAAAKAGKGKGGKGGGGGALLPPDDRAYTVGYREFPWTPLPARDGVPHGGVQRSSSAPNCSYFVNWTSKDDSMTWDIEVNTAGNYEVVIDYTAAEAGAAIELEFKGSKLAGKVAPAWNPPLYTNQDTITRPPAESQMKEFRPLNLGVMRLEKGRGLLTLRATDVPGKSVMDVRRVNLTLK
jgi:arylsulfatase A-like enzyme